MSVAEGEKGFIVVPVRADGLMTLTALTKEYQSGAGTSSASGEIAVVLRLKPELNGAVELRARILGGDRVLNGKVTAFDVNLLEVTCAAPQTLPGAGDEDKDEQLAELRRHMEAMQKQLDLMAKR